MPRLEYDRNADAIYISLRDVPYACGCDLDDERRIDYAADMPMGIELLDVSYGVNLDGLPQRGVIEQLLAAEQIRVFA